MPTYYVSTTGNDTTGDGSAGNPWLTLTKAEATAVDGDTVNVGAGTFEAATYYTFAKQITWVGAGILNTKLRGNNTARVIYLNSTKVKTFTGFNIDGLSSASVPNYQIEGGAANQATTFDTCWFTNAKTTTLRMNAGMSGVTIQNSTVDIGTTQTAVVQEIGGATGWTVQNCTINGTTGLTMSAIFYQASAVTSGTFVIHNNDITLLSNYAPIRFLSGGFVGGQITDNNFTVGTNNTRAILELIDMQTTCVVTGNTITIPSTSTSTIPIKCWNTVDTGPDCVYTIEDNIIYTHNADSYGILLGDEGGDINSEAGAFNGSSVRRNRLYFAPYFGLPIGAAHAIMMGGNTNIFYEDNYIFGAAYCAACKGVGEAWTDGYIQNNLFVNCTYPLRLKGQSSIRVVNNLIYNDGSQVGTSLSVTENGVGQLSENSFLRNNLCIRDADKVYEFMDTSFDTLDADYQGFYLTGTAQMGDEFPAATHATLADWQAGTGYDLHSISGNPNIKADYTIDAASIYFEKGIPVTGVTHIYESTKTYEMTLAGAAALSTDSPYKKRVQIS